MAETLRPKVLRIDKMLYGGNGLARADAREVNIPFVLPGEVVEIAADGSAHIAEASPDRVTPQCVHYLSCGGCHYQHASYPAQLAIKTSVLRDTLRDAGFTTGVPEIAIHSAEPWRYRNRIRLRVGEVDAELRVGYNRREATGGDALLPVVMCSIAAPLLWDAAERLVALAKTDLNVALWMKAAIEMELFTTGDESRLQLTLFIRKTVNASFANFCTLLQRSIPELCGAGIAILPAKPSPRGRRFEQAKTGAQWGAPGMMYSVAGESFWVSRGSFFQVNRLLVAELARLATKGRSGRLAWDLYAGVGLFSRALTNSFAQVIAVEAAEPAATDLANAIKANGSQHRAVAMTTVDFLEAAVVQRERPDLIVMDPPRAGVGLEVCSLLARIRAPEIVYVSCDPVTLARDLKELTGSGYTVRELHLVDMFPQTFHQETVAVLTR
jgi:23S rRNA (uracil1939-C5)-methyltransferase